MTTIFLQGEDGRRPVFGNLEKFQTDPHWRDLVLFHEYFHGDSGADGSQPSNRMDRCRDQANAAERRVRGAIRSKNKNGTRDRLRGS